MQVQVPIRYLANGRRAGNRINSSLPFQEMIDIELAVEDDASAPVVAAWDDSMPAGLDRPQEWGPTAGEEHVRFHDDAYWRPLRRYEILPGLTPLPREATREEFRQHAELQIRFIMSADTGQLGIAEFLGEAGKGAIRNVLPDQEDINSRKMMAAEDYFENVAYSFKAASVTPVAEAFRDLLAVDGLMYVRCHEPCLVVARHTYADVQGPYRMLEHGETIRVSTRLDNLAKLDEAMVFPLQKFKEALQYSRKGNGSKQHIKEHLNAANAKREPHTLSEYFLEPMNAAVSAAGAHIRQFLIRQEKEWNDPLKDTRKLRLFCDLKDAEKANFPESSLDVVERAVEEWLATYVIPGQAWRYPELKALEAARIALSQRPVDDIALMPRETPRY